MTKERVESIRKIVLPFIAKKLKEIDYEGLGESDAKEFTNDFNEILNLAEDAIEQDCISRKFEGIVVEYPPADLCIYPEYKGRPYFSIRYEENGEHIIGFGTYNPEVLTRYLQEYFISDIQPKTGHWIYDKNIENWRCSECGETPPTLGYCGTADFMAEHFKYCNHCGTRMIEPQESEDKDADKKCTYKETGCGSCKWQLDCPIEADKAESEVQE